MADVLGALASRFRIRVSPRTPRLASQSCDRRTCTETSRFLGFTSSTTHQGSRGQVCRIAPRSVYGSRRRPFCRRLSVPRFCIVCHRRVGSCRLVPTHATHTGLQEWSGKPEEKRDVALGTQGGYSKSLGSSWMSQPNERMAKCVLGMEYHWPSSCCTTLGIEFS